MVTCLKEKIVVQLEKNLFKLKSYVQLDRKFNIGNEHPNLLLSRIQTQPHAHEFMNFHLQNVQERKGDDHILCSDHPHLCTPTEPLHFFHDPDQREAIKAINQPTIEMVKAELDQVNKLKIVTSTSTKFAVTVLNHNGKVHS